MSIRHMFPWWLKIVVKLILSRLPLSYDVWKKIGLFKHGNMDQAQYAITVFENHVTRSLKSLDLANKVILELGPGDTISSAIMSKAYGGRAILIDAADYTTKNLDEYHLLFETLCAKGFTPPDVKRVSSLKQLLNICEASYLTKGISSMRAVESGSVDLIYSQAVLEHVRKNEFFDIMLECRRIIRDNGIISHRIDLKDHLEGGLNNLRFSEKVWESNFFVKSGFYTNRIRYSAMVGLMERAGFEVEILGVNKWSDLPIKRPKIHEDFSNLSNSELLVSGFDVLLRPI